MKEKEYVNCKTLALFLKAEPPMSLHFSGIQSSEGQTADLLQRVSFKSWG